MKSYPILERLNKTTQELSQILDLQSLYRESAQKACSLFQCKKSCILLWTSKGTWKIQASYGVRLPHSLFCEGNIEEWCKNNEHVLKKWLLLEEYHSFLYNILDDHSIICIADSIFKTQWGEKEYFILQILSTHIVLCQKNAELYEKANFDYLTGLYSRRYFDEYLGKKHLMSILMIDIDYFKNINDLYGHMVGDFVLQKIAHICKMSIRREDIAVRYGGEEFLILLETISPKIAIKVAERIRKKIQETKFEQGKYTFSISVSIGVSTYQKGDSLFTLIQRSDVALYKAKIQGRNQVCLGE
ncbi:MAG: GGDEF domain-containing protein [Planctomycetes bacterium]|jgi:diguanylate cyclase (GGDEF)-like protein|nr:GGDEF domain-containing protein [Planctomycetota bacterium]HNZ65802.1 GGDEF domain-containing protein [Planctomycetota bacterium]HON43788.1 GGDEF domain-containing protein [Planctomycetota bacterium]HPY74192.1 GGDEF domain-containing protein [Planctomycetota bacterium]HQA99806.1 GGDEF domain-containing protein [Planctomycetota bacterium]